MDQTAQRTINRLLARLQEACTQISAFMPLREITTAAVRRHPNFESLESALMTIYALTEPLEEALERVTLQETMLSDSPHARFYECEYRPNKRRLADTFIGLLFTADTDSVACSPSGATIRSVEATTTAKETLLAALKRHEKAPEFKGDEGDPQFDFKACSRLLSLPFFEPDLWLARHRLIGPLMLEGQAGHVPSHVRGRIREVHQAFAVGNFLAAVALTRSILEYALIERGRPLGYEPFETDKGPVKRLGKLIEAASAVRPSIRDQMERVRDIGNRVLHPTNNYNVIRFPHILETEALDSISAIREILVELYGK